MLHLAYIAALLQLASAYTDLGIDTLAAAPVHKENHGAVLHASHTISATASKSGALAPGTLEWGVENDLVRRTGNKLSDAMLMKGYENYDKLTVIAQSCLTDLGEETTAAWSIELSRAFSAFHIKYVEYDIARIKANLTDDTYTPGTGSITTATTEEEKARLDEYIAALQEYMGPADIQGGDFEQVFRYCAVHYADTENMFRAELSKQLLSFDPAGIQAIWVDKMKDFYFQYAKVYGEAKDAKDLLIIITAIHSWQVDMELSSLQNKLLYDNLMLEIP